MKTTLRNHFLTLDHFTTLKRTPARLSRFVGGAIGRVDRREAKAGAVFLLFPQQAENYPGRWAWLQPPPPKSSFDNNDIAYYKPEQSRLYIRPSPSLSSFGHTCLRIPLQSLPLVVGLQYPRSPNSPASADYTSSDMAPTR